MGNVNGMFNVKDAGAVGDGATDDCAAIIKAISDAVNAATVSGRMQALYFPPGRYRIAFTTGSLSLDIKGKLTILGAGQAVSTLAFEVDRSKMGAAEKYNGFTIAAGIDVVFRDLSISAPDPMQVSYTVDAATHTIKAAGHPFKIGDAVTVSGPDTPTGVERGQGKTYFVVNATADTFQISEQKTGGSVVAIGSEKGPFAFLYAQTYAGSAIYKFGGTGDLTMERVKISGGWVVGLNDRSGNHTTTLVSCDLQAKVVTCAIDWDGTEKAHDKRFYARDCDFRPSTEHHLYIHPVASVDLDHCRHYGALYYSVHIFGTDWRGKAAPPMFARITNCYFEDCQSAILTAAVATTKEYSLDPKTSTFTTKGHGLSEQQAIVFWETDKVLGKIPAGLKADTKFYARDITPATFRVSDTRGGPAMNIVGTADATSVWSAFDPTVYQISGCVFRRCGTSIRLNSPAKITACVFDVLSGISFDGLRNGDVDIADCDFRVAYRMINTHAADNCRLSVARSTIRKTASTASLIEHFRLLPSEPDTVLQFTQCTIIGEHKSAGMGEVSKSISFSECSFEGDWLGGINVSRSKKPITTELSFWRCRSTFNAPPLVDTNNAGPLVMLRVLGGENNFQGPLRLVTGIPNKRGDLCLRCAVGASLASGTTLLVGWEADTYHVTGTATIDRIFVVDEDSTNAVSGLVYLVADGTWSLSKTGNILPKSTTARSISELVALKRDPQTGKWIEL